MLLKMLCPQCAEHVEYSAEEIATARCPYCSTQLFRGETEPVKSQLEAIRTAERPFQQNAPKSIFGARLEIPILALVLISALSLFIQISGYTKTLKQTPPTKEPRVKWEYYYTSFGSRHTDDFHAGLRKAGQEGWELVGMTEFVEESKDVNDLRYNSLQVIFKRRLDPEKPYDPMNPSESLSDEFHPAPVPSMIR